MDYKQQLYQKLAVATRVMNSEIKKQIIEVGAVDTGRMKNVTIVKIEWREGTSNLNININTTDYYKYVDEGTRHISPRDITEKFMNRPKVEEQLGNVYEALALVEIFDMLD